MNHDSELCDRMWVEWFLCVFIDVMERKQRDGGNRKKILREIAFFRRRVMKGKSGEKLIQPNSLIINEL